MTVLARLPLPIDVPVPSPAVAAGAPPGKVPVWRLARKRARQIRVDRDQAVFLDGTRPCRLSSGEAHLVYVVREAWPWPVSKRTLINAVKPETARERAERNVDARRAAKERRERAFQQSVSGARDRLLPLGLLLVNMRLDIGSEFPSAFTIGDLFPQQEDEEPIWFVDAHYLERAGRAR